MEKGEEKLNNYRIHLPLYRRIAWKIRGNPALLVAVLSASFLSSYLAYF
jgi:hypothetical protein